METKSLGLPLHPGGVKTDRLWISNHLGEYHLAPVALSVSRMSSTVMLGATSATYQPRELVTPPHLKWQVRRTSMPTLNVELNGLCTTGAIIVEQSCDIVGFDGQEIGIGQETVYLDSSTRSFGICCRVQGPPGYRVTWLHNGALISSKHQGYVFGKGYLKFSGLLTQGCTKYTCQVENGDSKSETIEICVGGMKC